MKPSHLLGLFLAIGAALIVFASSKSYQQEQKLLGLFFTADQKWEPAPMVFGMMNTQLKNKVKGYAFFADGSIKRQLTTFSPGKTDINHSKLNEPENWGQWKNGPQQPDEYGFVIANWNTQPLTNDTLVVYPTTKRQKGYELEGLFKIYFSLYDNDIYSQDYKRDYASIEFMPGGKFGMKSYNTFQKQDKDVPFHPDDKGTYRIEDYRITFLFNDGRVSSTCFAHLPPKSGSKSNMIFLGDGYGFAEK